MSTGSRTPDVIRQAAIDDYHATGDTYAVVAMRHGVSRGALHSWVNPGDPKKREPKTWAEQEIAYIGGWELRGGVKYPLLPERRSA